ncbi:hypothetical protein CDD83_1512 [Cordyceps sp. RAO-2017]|nr:hypothetical protein CDD83_1512 [Cordyceps sp. RAO-2017]
MSALAALADVKWYAPAQADASNLMKALHSSGNHGSVYDAAPASQRRGCDNWCDMPHVRRHDYPQAAPEFELQYVELIHRHHKRTPYASNGFPVEPYSWDCDDVQAFHYQQLAGEHKSAGVYHQRYQSHMNPFVPSGWTGTCAFPQVTAQGLLDSWRHGADIYDVYHGLLGLLPARDADFRSAVRYRATNNAITSQVAGMIIGGMWHVSDSFPVLVQPEGVDSLEPQYGCRTAVELFDSIKSERNLLWRQHLEASADLFRALDNISLVPVSDPAFHRSFDHYYDNLSARQCHGKPLPCRFVADSNSTACVAQELANAVYRMGNWEYSQVYRDHPSSLGASAASFGIWIGELTAHLRNFINGLTDVVYFHNVAHDGSVSRLLSILQIENMKWPGMGAEVVFELYKLPTL